MARYEEVESMIEEMENKGYGCMFADLGSEKQVPYEMFSEKMTESVTALYFVTMTDDIFKNGLESLDGIEYVRKEVSL
ncbi:hypothetical protein [Bilifractor porci]|uniref:Uncharacterized protein n=1 Tax=Bilifractor porci TaxID=2606636 RepID=A0A7X2PA24_9FIRM|nr:hypothetical protein [Bilifractor porci]MST82498.1 hypothetical protein [Bilifractor porci]